MLIKILIIRTEFPGRGKSSQIVDKNTLGTNCRHDVAYCQVLSTLDYLHPSYARVSSRTLQEN